MVAALVLVWLGFQFLSGDGANPVNCFSPARS
jgi:hypothetical protein